MKICSLGAKLYHADMQADVMKPIVDFFSFANVPKNRMGLDQLLLTFRNLASYI